MVTQVSIRLLSHLQWNLSFGTPLFKGHLHSGDAKFGPGKTFTPSLYLLLSSIEGIPLFREKGHFFQGPVPGINLHSEETLIALKPWLTMKRVDEYNNYINCMYTVNDIWNKPYMNRGNEMKMKKWSSQCFISFPQFIYDLFHISLTLISFTGTYEPTIDLLPTSVAS